MADQMRLIDANMLEDKLHDTEFAMLCPLDEVCTVIDCCPTVDAVEVIRCAQCLYLSRNEETQKLSCGIHGHTLMELTDQSFCSAGMTEAQWLALHGDELEDGDPLKPK